MEKTIRNKKRNKKLTKETERKENMLQFGFSIVAVRAVFFLTAILHVGACIESFMDKTLSKLKLKPL